MTHSPGNKTSLVVFYSSEIINTDTPQSNRTSSAEKGPLYLLLLLTPVELPGHDVHDGGQCLVGSLHVEEGQAGAAGDDVHGGAGVLLHPVHHLRGRCTSNTATQSSLSTR